MNLLTMLRRTAPAPATPSVDIATLPDPILTTRERAWSTLWYLEGHKDEWNQKVYGRFTDRTRTATVGCFAHHLCRGAGYEEFGCFVNAINPGALKYYVSLFGEPSCMDGRACLHADWVNTESGWESVSTTATRLLNGYGAEHTLACSDLFGANNSIRDLRRKLPKLVGPEPKNRR